MRLRRSGFAHLIPLGGTRFLLIHAASQLHLTVDAEVAAILDYFAEPRTLPDDFPGLAARVPYEQTVLVGCLATLMERGFLTEKGPSTELSELAAALGATHGRDPGELLDRYRRETKEGPEPYWAAGEALKPTDLDGAKRKIKVVLFGDCDVQMEADFMRREAAQRGIDLRIAATFPDDLRLVAEQPHDAVLIGALRARHDITRDVGRDAEAPAYAVYTAEARRMLAKLRELTAAPILIDNLPEPTVQPLGLAERGLDGHRNRFRLANLSLSDLACEFSGVHVVDIAAALAAAGAERLVDDGQVGFTHFGSPGWMLQRPESEKAAVHGLFPDVAPLARAVGGDPYGREAVTARAHVDALQTALGIDRKKCVIVDLDGVLWPGVLAETGAPFAWSPEVSGAFSYIGHYFGLHEALLCLKRRGLVLACVSKNDEATVRELWRYPDHYPKERLLTLDDFVTVRINWTDKAENIASIADELGFAEDAFLFIDDHPIERDRVRQRLPAVEVWGEDLFALRRRLLSDPRLQVPTITAESGERTALVKAQLVRQQLRNDSLSEADYLASLQIERRFERLKPGDALERIEELFARTTQFNATGRKFSLAELQALVAAPGGFVGALHVADRFGDHGLVGAAVVEDGEVLGLAVSCRVLGLGVEHDFMHWLIAELGPAHPQLTGRIVQTTRNMPVRNIYRDNGFAEVGDGLWTLRADGFPWAPVATRLAS